MAEQVYRLRLVLAGGGIVEAEVAHPLLEFDAERSRVVRFDWQDPADKSATRDPSKIVAVTLEELPAGTMAF